MISSSPPGLFWPSSTNPAYIETVGPSPLQLFLSCGFRGNLPIPYKFSRFILAWVLSWIKIGNRFSTTECCAFTNPKSMFVGPEKAQVLLRWQPAKPSLRDLHPFLPQWAMKAFVSCDHYWANGWPPRAQLSLSLWHFLQDRGEETHEYFEEAQTSKDIFNNFNT